ncbi:DUF4199 domain-containing protein [Marinoscillum furvescens]|uniref:Uncharacterized protein DUF4199 n=1 Tax=Marinoscillum furvescens DSM 4134 TaxID=1122208 RepID=A0A3D9KWW9_MARFU|nr:DUF4199 domain-containing protein [Marinoscillum furvescens]RED91761.1 uncharacterized protein DUF4199 [Marinoscillum furvescens DSM 4134]
MEETNVSMKSVAIKYGVINGLIAIIFFIIIDFAGLYDNQYLNWVGVLVTAALIFFAQKEYLREGDGYMNYGQGVGLGTLLALVSSCISAVFTFIYVKFINTSFIENIKEVQRMSMEEQGMSDDQIDQALSISEKFMTPGMMVVFGIVGGVIAGVIISLIISAINKNSRPEFE